AIARGIVLQIHHLDAEIEPSGGGIGGFRGDRVLLAGGRRFAVDQEAGTGSGIDDDAFADDDTLEWLQLDPPRHRRLSFGPGAARAPCRQNAWWKGGGGSHPP